MNVGAELMIGAMLVSALPFQGAGAGRSPPDGLAATESGSNAPTLAQEKDKAFVIKASQAGRIEAHWLSSPSAQHQRDATPPGIEGVQSRRIQQLPASIQPRPGPQESNRFDVTVLRRRGAELDSALRFTRIKKGVLTTHRQNGGTCPAWQASIAAWTPASVRRPLIMLVVAS